MNKEFSAERLVDYLEQNIFVKDADSKYLFCNKAYAELLGTTPAAIVGRDDYAFFPPEIADKYRTDDRRIFDGEPVIDVREDIVVDGESRVIQTVKKPMRDDAGNTVAVLGIFWDISDEVRKAKELEEVKDGLAQAQELAHIGHWELNLVKNSLYWSDEVYRIFGLLPQQFGATYEAFLEHVHPADVEAVNAAYSRSVAEKSGYHIEHRIVRSDGSIGYVEERCVHDFDGEGNVIRSIGTVHDITEQKAQAQELILAAQVFRNTKDGILVTDAHQNILQVNDAFLRISGYSRDEVIGSQPSMLSSGWHDSDFYEKMWHALISESHWSGEVWDRRKSGELYVAELAISAIRDGQGNILNYVAVTSDITEKKEKEQQIRNLAYYDALTQLPNRVLFQERVEQRLRVTQRNEQKLAIFFFDLDNFKFINDSMGHYVGDEFLKIVVKRLSAVLREEDSLSRLGGDEFALMMENVEDVNQLAVMAQKILNSFNAPFFINGREVYSGCSIGISIFPDDGDSYNELIRAADTAMYHVKDSGKNSYQFFTEAMNAKATQRLTIENDLRNALVQDEFFLTYQPKVDTVQRRIYGMEALLRWRHPKRGMVWPDQFIPIAEESGLIYQMGLWVAHKACMDTKRMHEEGLEGLVVSINVSGVQLKDEAFVDDMINTIEATGISPEFVELEITESALMYNLAEVLIKLEALHAYGVSLAIDDFGTGYSSLSYLKKLPVDTLKIDKSFVLDIDKDPDDRSITQAIIVMAKSLQIDTIAEGSETQAHVDVLGELGCEKVQGYFFGKPMEYDLFVEKVHECRRCSKPVSSCLDCNDRPR